MKSTKLALVAMTTLLLCLSLAVVAAQQDQPVPSQEPDLHAAKDEFIHEALSRYWSGGHGVWQGRSHSFG